MKRLIAIDGNSLMHRAYYALPSMTTKDGTPTGGDIRISQHAIEAAVL